VPTGLTFRQLNLLAALNAVPQSQSQSLEMPAIANKSIAPGGSVVVPLNATGGNGAAITYSAQIINLPALAWQLKVQLGLSTTGSYYTNTDGQNEEWLIGHTGQWYWILPDGEFRQYAGSVAATLQPANLVAMLSPAYYANPELLWYPQFVPFQPIGLTIAGNQLTVAPTSATWTGSAVIQVTANAGGNSVNQTFTLTVAAATAPPAPPVIAALPNLTVKHSQGTLLVALSATDPAGRAITFSAAIAAANGQTPPIGVSVTGTQLSLAPALSFLGTYTVVVTASNGVASATTSFTVTVTDVAAQLAAVAAQSMAAGQTSLTLPLSATDADGDALTYSASVEVPSAAAYQLQQQLGLYQYNGSYYQNLYGDNEKWLVAANGIWYALLPSGQLYRWDATMAQTVQAASLVATFDPIFWTYPQLLLDAPPPVAPAITWAVKGNQLLLQRPAGLTGVFLIQVTATDGAVTSAPQTFLLTLN
jgi:hypothetical protein